MTTKLDRQPTAVTRNMTGMGTGGIVVFHVLTVRTLILMSLCRPVTGSFLDDILMRNSGFAGSGVVIGAIRAFVVLGSGLNATIPAVTVGYFLVNQVVDVIAVAQGTRCYIIIRCSKSRDGHRHDHDHSENQRENFLHIFLLRNLG